jgi:hypothetical protein
VQIYVGSTFDPREARPFQPPEHNSLLLLSHLLVVLAHQSAWLLALNEVLAVCFCPAHGCTQQPLA